MNAFRLCTLATILAAAACSSSGPTNDAGTNDASTNDSGGKKDSGVKDTGPVDDSGDDAGPTPTIDPLCSAPNTPSNGSCVADAGFGCNPVSSVACKTDAGEACDFGGNDFMCYPPPPPNTAGLCETCDPGSQTGPACLSGSTCVQVDQQGTLKCAKFCCNDNDCTGGKCDNTTLSGGQATPFGFCVK